MVERNIPTESNIVEQIYWDYENSGVRDTSFEIIQRVDAFYRDPLLYSHQLGKLKSKPMMPFYIGTDQGITSSVLVPICSSTDVLWTLSTIVDDIEDRDEMRKQHPSTWVLFGKQYTYQAAEKGFEQVKMFLANYFGDEWADLCNAWVLKGLASMQKQKTFQLNTDLASLMQNYIDRDAFFSTFPLELILKASIKNERNTAISGLQAFELAGQIGNDLQDFYTSGGGENRFSDIRNKLVTVPIRMLWETIDPRDREFFLAIFGNDKLKNEQSDRLRSIFESHNIINSVLEYIGAEYERAKTLLSGIMSDEHNQMFSQLCEFQKNKFLQKTVLKP